MRFLRIAGRSIAAAIFIMSGLFAGNRMLAPAESPFASPQNFVLDGNKHYFAGRPEKAVSAYERALRRDERKAEAWINGAAVLADLGRTQEAARWYRRAAELRPDDPKVRTALGELELMRGRVDAARVELDRVIESHPREPHALIARGLVALASGRPQAAIPPLEEAARLAPDLTLASFWLGRARDAAGRHEAAIEAYERAVSDSYFTRARYRLTEALARRRYLSEAREHASKLVAAAPSNAGFRRLDRSVRRLAVKTRRTRRRPDRAIPAARTSAAVPKSRRRPAPVRPPSARVPVLRIGIGTTGMGKPLSWRGLRFSANSRFTVIEKGTGKQLARGRAWRRWEVRLTGASRRVMELRDPEGRRAARTRRGIVIRPRVRGRGWTRIEELHPRSSRGGLKRRLRGGVELSLQGKGLKVVNVVDLESYTHGVLSAEMPVASPMEALKAQAVLARTHALFIKNVRRRHRREGYDLCDGQHCQVYGGVRAETRRSRAIVDATVGRVVTHHGGLANVLYSSNCGGHTQSAGDVKGWGDVPYFKGSPDAHPEVELPASPWELRQWLRRPAPAYCQAPSHAHPSHFRWTRVIPAAELRARLDRHLHIGRLHAIVPMKRSPSGHLNSILVRGSRGSRIVTSEMQIRGLFGIGSQRSSLFVMDTERDPEGRPLNFVFYGGGWGHGVGMCQSGAMGRAERGQSYGRILKAYYRGIEIGNLRY